MWSVRRVLFLFVFGGICGALCDQLHTQLGVLYYESPLIFGQAWWVPMLFGFGTLAIFAAANVVLSARARSKATLLKPSVMSLATASLWFVGAYVASCFFFDHPFLVLGAFLAAWAARMSMSPLPRETIMLSLFLGLAGPGWEIFLTSTGIYTFNHPDFARVPAWLPGLYMMGAPLAISIAQAFGAGERAGLALQVAVRREPQGGVMAR